MQEQQYLEHIFDYRVKQFHSFDSIKFIYHNNQ